MSRKRHPLKIITRISSRFIRRFLANTKKQIIWLLRTIFGTQKRQTTANAGFVLPTVAMVSVVVILLTTAIMLRSFDRAKNASNVRVNEAVLSAATPAIDRGRAKIAKLFQDRSLPRATPTDDALYNTLIKNIDKYTFGDETKLKLEFEFNGESNIQTPTDDTPIALNRDETVKTAWRFPVDTDNNGKFDSYTLYGILFRTPPVVNVTVNGQPVSKYQRARNPLEARTPPMSTGTADANCGGTTSASLVGNTGWVRQDNELKKSFFVYTATVPITGTPPGTNYETYKGASGFAAVEYQQDRIQIPPNNNAVVYEDDIALTPGPAFNLNGAVFTNSNLLTSNTNGGAIKFYQVSSKSSCFYDAKNAKIIVGGNTGRGGFTNTSQNGSATVDLYQGKTTNASTSSWIESTTNAPNVTAYNNLAYAKRINELVNAQMANGIDSDPQEVKDGIEKKKVDLDLDDFTPVFDKYRRENLTLYFKIRTRRVPYTEVAFGVEETNPSPLLQGAGDTLRPNDKWIYPTDPTDGKTGTNYTKLTLKTSGSSLEPQATEPTELKKNSGKEGKVGDRVLVGNNLPELWWDKTKEQFVGSGLEDTQEISGIKWNLPTGTNEVRTRKSLVQTLADVGSTDRDGEWELDAAKVPSDPTEPVGGLRVITGAGIYLNNSGTPSSFDGTIKEIWPDSNPAPQVPFAPPPQALIGNGIIRYDASTKTIQPYSLYNLPTAYKWHEIADDPDTESVNESQRPFLQMRATAVYHYKSAGYNAKTPKPIACVSSFYVPTNSYTAKNKNGLPWNAATDEEEAVNSPFRIARSNNGIVYPAPTKTFSDYENVLNYQSELTYPKELSIDEGRSIDGGLLKTVVDKIKNNKDLTISEQSAIDAQICALQILDGSISPDDSMIDHGAIKEITFLDSREVQQNSISGTSQTYDMPIRDRQPLEIRATVLDIDKLRKKAIAGSSPTEYLLPNSGIIYATRDDALPDSSDYWFTDTKFADADPDDDPTIADKKATSRSVSPVDYRLDSTRRPNGIMLINGEKLWRTSTYRDEEKGLILATNLPVYIKGDFNKHTKEEFTQTLADNWSNFYTRSTLDPNFACRKGDPRLKDCTTGDEWRPATVLADAVTLLSDNFRTGFRDEGEYDWNNSLVGTALSRFSRFNFLGAMGTWADKDNSGYPRDFDTTDTRWSSSYVSNFVTPLVMQIPAREYAYEICNSTVEADCFCTATDSADECKVKTKRWVMTNVTQKAYKDNGQNSWRDDGIGSATTSIKTGFIGDPPTQGWEDLPFKRLAFKRNVDTTALITPLTLYGKGSSNKLEEFSLDGTTQANIANPIVLMPWLVPVANNSTALEPVLQLRQPFATPANPDNTVTLNGGKDNKRWLQEAGADTTFNLIFAAGDSPARADGSNSEDNGGLHNFVRFMENWHPQSSRKKVMISGAFMQVKKSAYATGPFTTAFINGTNNELRYAIEINSGKGTGYLPPIRQWGYDVALLSQSPDLFASKLVLTPPDLPDEYVREVGRDDKWVQTLLCAKKASDNNKAIDDNQRPSNCPS
ncbi:hormogonium polysaccharide biosynthesis protein HpsA [Anabaena sp. UHCC 0204]|uniref:hormogonium polysaccharide biosynthesis protein HpsA n=1 Tax=Anabaena sp. UHCC 0204 TaxID=2590009 RepID=UPI001445D934|nr:hormogonium polysaccharide biosynthesis protein HpsA [Anabaena sp. UHCC 0204]MTJ06617.1 hypothetical protein [Anabaena sp. UHCC 0204]